MAAPNNQTAKLASPAGNQESKQGSKSVVEKRERTGVSRRTENKLDPTGKSERRLEGGKQLIEGVPRTVVVVNNTFHSQTHETNVDQHPERSLGDEQEGGKSSKSNTQGGARNIRGGGNNCWWYIFIWTLGISAVVMVTILLGLFFGSKLSIRDTQEKTVQTSVQPIVHRPVTFELIVLEVELPNYLRKGLKDPTIRIRDAIAAMKEGLDKGDHIRRTQSQYHAGAIIGHEYLVPCLERIQRHAASIQDNTTSFSTFLEAEWIAISTVFYDAAHSPPSRATDEQRVCSVATRLRSGLLGFAIRFEDELGRALGKLATLIEELEDTASGLFDKPLDDKSTMRAIRSRKNDFIDMIRHGCYPLRSTPPTFRDCAHNSTKATIRILERNINEFKAENKDMNGVVSSLRGRLLAKLGETIKMINRWDCDGDQRNREGARQMGPTPLQRNMQADIGALWSIAGAVMSEYKDVGGKGMKKDC